MKVELPPIFHFSFTPFPPNIVYNEMRERVWPISMKHITTTDLLLRLQLLSNRPTKLCRLRKQLRKHFATIQNAIYNCGNSLQQRKNASDNVGSFAEQQESASANVGSFAEQQKVLPTIREASLSDRKCFRQCGELR